MSLIDRIKQQILQDGYVTVAALMHQALYDLQDGYYQSKDPVGKDGDFITAPEISQLFGEAVGVWCLQQWQQLGSPDSFYLVELGPGRGTLMADVLRTVRVVPAFMKGASVHLIEVSMPLKSRQKQTLATYNIRWHESLESLPTDKPCIVIANEFLDALPVRQFQYTDAAWHERVVRMDNEQNMMFCQMDKTTHIGNAYLPEESAVDGNVLEICDAAHSLCVKLYKRLVEQTGAALFIDYGYVDNAYGDTLQAMKQHKHTAVFDTLGKADLTCQVNFGIIRHIAEQQGLHATLNSQRDFLLQFGIRERLATLYKNTHAEQQQALLVAYQRLTSPEKMGLLFKALSIASTH